MTPLRTVIARRLRREVIDRKLTYGQVAQRCGLHPRTVERFLEGDTFSPETADAIAVGLRIELDDSTEERLLRGVALHRLDRVRGMWVRLSDLARHVGCGRASVVRRVDRAVAVRQLGDHEVERGVLAADLVEPVLGWPARGETMVSVRAALWVLLTADSAQGRAAIGVLVDDGLRRLRSR